jgi:plasmid stabilization system protein ParE
MDVLLRDSVFADLEGISAWIAKDNPRAAQASSHAFSMPLALRGPGLGHAGKVPGTREWVVRGLPYIIVYQPNPDLDELTVLAVFHGARDR